MPSVWASVVRWLTGDRARAEPRDADAKGEIRYEGGDGRSLDDPIVIRGAHQDLMGTWAEFAFLEATFGKKDRDWTLRSHSHGSAGAREIDIVCIELADGEALTLHFDITESFGRW